MFSSSLKGENLLGKPKLHHTRTIPTLIFGPWFYASITGTNNILDLDDYRDLDDYPSCCLRFLDIIWAESDLYLLISSTEKCNLAQHIWRDNKDQCSKSIAPDILHDLYAIRESLQNTSYHRLGKSKPSRYTPPRLTNVPFILWRFWPQWVDERDGGRGGGGGHRGWNQATSTWVFYYYNRFPCVTNCTGTRARRPRIANEKPGYPLF